MKYEKSKSKSQSKSKLKDFLFPLRVIDLLRKAFGKVDVGREAEEEEEEEVLWVVIGNMQMDENGCTP